MTNKLFHGDNLDVPREQIADESAELFQGKKPDISFVDPASVKRAKREDMSQQGSLL